METQRKKVLIIEDDFTIRRAVEFRLSKEDFDVLVAENGADGIAKAVQDKPNIIVLDLIMSKVNGFEALRQLKADKDTKDIPIIVFSNLSQDTDVEEAKTLGAVEYLVKSEISIDKLVEEIKNFIK